MIPQIAGSRLTYASYNGVRSDSVQFFFPGPCGAGSPLPRQPSQQPGCAAV